MTKRFALADTLPDPYFTIDAGGARDRQDRLALCRTHGGRNLARWHNSLQDFWKLNPRIPNALNRQEHENRRTIMTEQKRRPEQVQDQTVPACVDHQQKPELDRQTEPKAREIPSPADLFKAWQEGGAEGLGKLMATMDGEHEDDSLPAWDERRLR